MPVKNQKCAVAVPAPWGILVNVGMNYIKLFTLRVGCSEPCRLQMKADSRLRNIPDITRNRERSDTGLLDYCDLWREAMIL